MRDKSEEDEIFACQRVRCHHVAPKIIFLALAHTNTRTRTQKHTHSYTLSRLGDEKGGLSAKKNIFTPKTVTEREGNYLSNLTRPFTAGLPGP